jgi:HK97 gp10 family phage protein
MARVRIIYDGRAPVLAMIRGLAARQIAAIAFTIEAEAKRRAPVDTGFLRSSIRAVQKGPLHWVVGVGAAYALFIEFGTRRQRAQPFFSPAVAAGRRLIERLASRRAGGN